MGRSRYTVVEISAPLVLCIHAQRHSIGRTPLVRHRLHGCCCAWKATAWIRTTVKESARALVEGIRPGIHWVRGVLVLGG